jgi:hypothetical protein
MSSFVLATNPSMSPFLVVSLGLRGLWDQKVMSARLGLWDLRDPKANGRR